MVYKLLTIIRAIVTIIIAISFAMSGIVLLVLTVALSMNKL
jgi:hypothetical protein